MHENRNLELYLKSVASITPVTDAQGNDGAVKTIRNRVNIHQKIIPLSYLGSLW